MAPAEFFLFPKLKTPMKGKRFAMIEKIKEKSKQEPLAIMLFRSVSRIEKKCWHMCIISEASYFEGDKIVVDK